MTSIRTTCPYCGVGCGVSFSEGTLRGDTAHPANSGRLCSKGAALGETLALPDRLLAPTVNGQEAGWDETLDVVATRFRDTIDRYGPDSVAFYVSGQFLTEDYYVANKLMKGFIGSGNIDTNSRLCMASSVAAHVRAFGEDVVPGCYEDLEQADLVVIAGSNMAWCHPVLHQRLMAAREKRGTKIVVIDPRRTATCETADLHLPLSDSSDTLLFSGLLVHLSATSAVSKNWTERHVSGFTEACYAAVKAAPSNGYVAAKLGIPLADLLTFYEMFSATERVVTLYSQGMNQSNIGTDKVNAIINCHLATGRIGRPGMGPFSLTGQPNAMGGREVGGLANQLAAHMAFADEHVDRVRRFWNAPRITTRPGLKAVDMFRAVGEGKIKAIWIAATNPAVSMPRAAAVREALASCPFVVVSDAWPTDTTRYADVILPAASWSEKDGTVTNSERCISRQRALRAPPGSARPDWWMFAEVGKRMGWHESFSYASPAVIFREHAALSSFENDGKRVFDIGALSDCDDEAYEALEPFRWPLKRDAVSQSLRLFGDGVFPTSDGRARMIAVASHDEQEKGASTFRLNTGRVRDQWHTMTRTGRVPRLLAHTTEPQLALHPDDARALGLNAEDLARVESDGVSTVLRVSITEAQKPSDAFVPMHWTDQFSSASAANRLVHDKTDPHSGQPDLKGSTVRITPVKPSWVGLLLRRSGALCEMKNDVYWSKVPMDSGFAFDLAGWSPLKTIISSEQELRQVLGVPAEAEVASYSDAKRGIFRYVGVLRDRLEACLFFAREASGIPTRAFASRLLSQTLPDAERLALLAGQNNAIGSCANDEIVCSCYLVGAQSLNNAIRTKGLKNVSEIGTALRAGTNCGSCVPELKRILAETYLAVS